MKLSGIRSQIVLKCLSSLALRGKVGSTAITLCQRVVNPSRPKIIVCALSHVFCEGFRNKFSRRFIIWIDNSPNIFWQLSYFLNVFIIIILSPPPWQGVFDGYSVALLIADSIVSLRWVKL